MRYIGSKKRIFKYIKPFLLQHIEQSNKVYLEPFVGGANSLIQFNWYNLERRAWDINPYLIALWQQLRLGWEPPARVTKEEYEHIKLNMDRYPPHEVGYAGIMFSFGGTWFRGYCGDMEKGVPKNAVKNLIREAHKLYDVKFECRDFFRDWELIKPYTIVYCDPPYMNDTVNGYSANKYDYNIYRALSRKAYVYISESVDGLPRDFERLFTRTFVHTNKGARYIKKECLYTYMEGLAAKNMTALARFQSESLV